MKKVIFLSSLLCFLFSNCSSAQQNQTLTKAKFIGTWKAQESKSGETFYFSVYPNNRTFAYGQGWERWEKYDIEEGEYCAFNEETDEETYCLTVAYFDGKNIKYSASTGRNYTAEKISDKQIRVSLPKPEVKQNQGLTKNKLVGTWKSYKVNMDETFYFICYPNGKVTAYDKNNEESRNYYIEGNTYYSYTTDRSNPVFTSTITYFDGKTMKYTSSDGWRYEAQKVSETPVKVPYDNKIVNHKHMLLRSVDCAFCHNTCRMNCMFCAGAGGTYEPVMNYSTGNTSTQYKSCTHCAGTGKSLCLHCDCGRHD
jgi:hypothetical protein